ncbi:iron reductase domain protein [Amniculicola lignicola CBS 123094]|uniref:Iron reductase domain protein n=1 Tax=Amniculicola lignicola CBS 123094 TaxID=1392246 RepID=A0A6A5X107_9PLEO|nr:iron reductase domain protein [Amniculicola lignicola CBS 123094]
MLSFPLVLSLRVVATDPISVREEEQNFSTFIYKAGEGNLTFSLNAEKSTGDVFFHITAPESYQWVSVGTGEEMRGSVMWVIYKSSEKMVKLTFSPRLSDGKSEPSYSSSISCSMVDSDSSQNGIITIDSKRYYSANVYCLKVTSLGHGGGRLDLANAKQPFLYAFGPTNKPISSKSLTAGIRRHESYGDFWVDMTKATSNSAEVLSGEALTTAINAGAEEGAESDGDKAGPTHAVLMLGSFALLFPLGAVLLRYFESVKIHWLVQLVGMLTTVVGTGVGLYLGRMYNHSKDVSSGHQIAGIVLLLLVFLQFGIGGWHHFQYRKYKNPTKYGTIHRYAGPFVVLAGIINGFTGFNFSGESENNVYYGIVVGLVLVAVIGMLAWKGWSKKKETGMPRNRDPADGVGLNAMPKSYEQM